MDIVIIGLLLGGTYALMAMGLQLQYGVARIMNLANGEILIAGAFSTFWFYTAHEGESAARVVPGRVRRLRRELGDLPHPDLSARAPRQEPGSARGRQHPGDLRHELHRGRHSARHLRRRISQLLLSGAADLHLRRALWAQPRRRVPWRRRRSAPALYLWLHKTRAGLALRAVSVNPRPAGLVVDQRRARFGARLCAGRSGDRGRAAGCSACS